MNEQYRAELATAQKNLDDAKRRGISAVGESWDAVRHQLFTKEEIAESDLRVELIGEIIKARSERGFSQKKLEELTGVRQPVIARMECGTNNPTLSTMMKLLLPLGKTLQVVDLPQPRA
jgi:ribosome-binding protein aMBF1 (putative translation factor)